MGNQPATDGLPIVIYYYKQDCKPPIWFLLEYFHQDLGIL